jgi:hypothetical protein
MMNINSENYEAFLLDFMEGNLNEEQVAALMRFLEEHPEKKEELMLFDSESFFTPNSNEELNKDLFKAPEAESFDELLVSHIEGLLSEAEKEKTEKLISHNSKIRQDYNLFLKTILKPDLTVVFDEKNKLKKKSTGKIRVLYYAVSSAAAVLLLLVLNNVFNTGYTDPLKNKLPANPVIIEEKIGKEVGNSFESKPVETENNQQIVFTPSLKKDRKHADNITIETISDPYERIAEETRILTEPNEVLIAQHTTEEVKIKELQEKIITAPNESAYEIANKKEALTAKDLIAQRIKSYFGKNNDDQEKLTAWQVADTAGKELSKVTGKELKISKTKKEDGNGFDYALIIGKFEFTTAR